MKKRFVAFLLVLIMVLGMLPVSAMAALDTGHMIDVTFTVLYVGDEFRIGYNYGTSEKTQFVCQYTTNHSDTAYNNHEIAISDIKAAANRATVNSGYQIVGWSKESNANPKTWGFDLKDPTACNKGTTIYLVAKNPNPEVTYTLNYYENTTDIVTNMPSPKSETQKSSTSPVTFTVSNNRPERADYTFLGWADDANATAAQYHGGDPIVLTKDNLTKTIYAVWKENQHKHHDGDGDGFCDEDHTCMHEKDGDGYCTIPGCTHSDSCCPKRQDPQPDIPDPRNNITGMQVYTECVGENPKHPKIGTQLSSLDGWTVDWKPGDTTATLNLPLDALVKNYSEYVHEGTALGPHNLDATRNQDGKVALTYKDGNWDWNIPTVYVECVKMATLHYDKNTTDEVTNMPADEKAPMGENNSASFMVNSTKIPVRAGYTFLGWSLTTEKPTEPAAVWFPAREWGHNLTAPDGTTLYAIWEKNDAPDIYLFVQPVDSSNNLLTGENALLDSTLEKAGFTGGYNHSNKEWITVGKMTTALALPTFKKMTDITGTWLNAVKHELETGTYTPHADAADFQANISQAIWTKLQYLTDNYSHRGYDELGKCEGYHLDGLLTFYYTAFENGLPNGSTETVGNMPVNNYDDIHDYYISGGTVTMPDAPTRDGYTFLGWKAQEINNDGAVAYANRGSELYQPGQTYDGISKDVVFTAQWEAKKANVRLMIFKSGDLSKPIVNVPYTTDKLAGDTLDLTALDPKTYLKFDFEIDGGWYDDGRFNRYKKYVNGEQENKPAALTELQINGNWQNLKLIVTELVPVVYFDSLESLTAYQNDHSKTEGILHTTKARVGSALPTADAPDATREGYTFTFWSREGQTGDVTDQTVNGWTNLYANWEKKTYKVVAKLYVNGKPAYYQNEDFYTYEASGLYGEDIDFDTIKAKAVEQAKQIKKASASYTAVILEDHEPNPVCTTYGEHQPGQATHYVKVNVKTEENVVIFQSFEGKTDLTKLRTTTAPYGTNVVEFLNGLGLDLDVAGYTLDTAEDNNTNWYKKDSPKWTFGTNDTINGWTNVLLKYTITPHNIYAYARLNSYFAPLTADEFDTHITLNDATLSRLGLGSYNSLCYIPIGTFDFDEMPLTEDLYMAYYEDPEIDAVAEELAKSIVLETGVTKETALKIVWASLFKNVNKENMELGYPTDDAEGYQFTGNLYLATVAFKAGGDNVKNMPAVNYTYDDFFEIHDFYFPGETVTLTEPTREGYTFKGWSVTVLPGAEDASALSLTGAGDAADDEDLLPAGTVYTVTAGGAIFTAQWELKTYIIASDLRLNGTTVMVVKPDPAKSYPWSHRYGDEFGKTIDYTDMFKTLKEKALEVDAANEPYDVEIELRFPGDKNRDGKLFNEVITTYGQTGGGWNPGNKNTAPIWGYGTSLYEVIFDYDYDDKTDTQIVKYSEKATSVTPTREGYNFLGWFNADGTEFSFDTEITHKTTVTAKWEKKTYTIASDLRINGNVANLEDTGRYAWTHRYGDKFGETIDYQPMFDALKARALAVDAANEPCDAEIELRFPGDKNRDGKLFNETIQTYGQAGGGWNPGVKNTAYIWGYATTSYQVIFDADGSAVDKQIVKYGEKATEPTAPTKTGYTFDGWYDADGNKFDFTNNTITHKTVLTAKWTANTYKVKFAANGGEGKMDDQIFTYDEEKALTTNAFTRAGYTFANWKDAAGNTYTDGQKVKNLTSAANGEVTLTAQWTANTDTPYKVEHYLENLDGSYTLDTTEDLKGTTDTTATATPKTDYANFTYDGTVDGTVASGNIAGDGSLVLKLYYTRNTYTYTIKHIKQLPDGTYDVANAEVETLNGKFEALAAVTAKNYGSHYPTNDAGTKQNIKVVSGLVIEVRYDLDYHTLTFDTMGGSKIDPETVRHGLTVAKPKDPVNGGYWFDGWYTDKTYRTPYNFATPLTQDTTIYAKWFLIVLPGVTVKKAAPKLNTSDHFAYVQGYPDGTVKPAGNITRAETAAILFRLMDESSRSTYYSTRSGFRDVASGTWYNTYVATLNNAGVITDSANGYFRPNDAITRAELAAMLAAFTDTTHAANYFNDVTANYWAANAIAVCAKLGWITGYPDGSFRPDRNVTRAELMAMINRATGRAPKSADAFLPGMKTWSDNTADKWYYLDVQEATNSHSYTVRPTEIWTAITAAPNWSKYE